MPDKTQTESIPEFEIALPPCTRYSQPANIIKTHQYLVIVGANGAGKSRLAEWLEKQDPKGCHRVSAQRALAFPEDFRPTSINEAQSDLLYGHKKAENKFGFRWKTDRHDQLLDDFQKLVTLLFSEGAQV